MSSLSNSVIIGFMGKCETENGFQLPVVQSSFFFSVVADDIVNEIFKINAIKTQDAFTFVDFLFRFKADISPILGVGYKADAFHALDYLENWSEEASLNVCDDGISEFIQYNEPTYSPISIKVMN